MGLDIDAVFAQKFINELKDLLLSIPHGERSDFTDDLNEFVDKMKEKYGKPS